MWKSKYDNKPLIVDPKDWTKEEYNAICKLFGLNATSTQKLVIRENYHYEYDEK